MEERLQKILSANGVASRREAEAVPPFQVTRTRMRGGSVYSGRQSDG